MPNPDIGRWDDTFTIGGWDEESYAALPEDMRLRIEAASAASADRARRRGEGLAIPLEEIDSSGLTENELPLLPTISAQVRNAVELITRRMKVKAVDFRKGLLPVVADRLRALGLNGVASDGRLLDGAFAKVINYVGGGMERGTLELTLNAIFHGHCTDPRKTVHAAYRIAPKGKMTFRVRDEGNGFDPSIFLDEEAYLDRLEWRHGRGIMIADGQIGSVEYSEGGKVATARGNIRTWLLAAIAKMDNEEFEPSAKVEVK